MAGDTGCQFHEVYRGPWLGCCSVYPTVLLTRACLQGTHAFPLDGKKSNHDAPSLYKGALSYTQNIACCK